MCRWRSFDSYLIAFDNHGTFANKLAKQNVLKRHIEITSWNDFTPCVLVSDGKAL